MDLREFFLAAANVLSESLSASVAIVAGSFFLYSLFADINNRVARSFSSLLGFVTLVYIGDLGVSYSADLPSAVMWLGFQWIGIAFAPAAYVHLSHAILEMSGLASRGRRRWAVRGVYLVALLFLLLVWFSDWIVHDPLALPAPHFQPGPGFGLFVAYFATSVVASFAFLTRALRRTITPAVRRRLAYLLAVYAAPAIAVFPFLLISGRSLDSPIIFYGLLILADFTLTVMLSIMAYSMAFVGNPLPDRLIRARMLQFFLRGPVVAMTALAVILIVPGAGAVLGLPGETMMPILTVMVILFMQWAITAANPALTRWLVYRDEEDEIHRLQEIEERLLTGADFRQLLDSILAATCERLRVKTAFVASLTGDRPQLERALGLEEDVDTALQQVAGLSLQIAANGMPRPEDIHHAGDLLAWGNYFLLPLHFRSGPDSEPRIVGLLGVAQPAQPLDKATQRELMALATRSAEVLENRRLQAEVLAALEPLLPRIVEVQATRHRFGQDGDEDVVSLDSPELVARIRDALSHYWGGPNLTEPGLMQLSVVQKALAEHDGNPQRAMRAVLTAAIENLRPEGQRSLTTTEWILYNILEMRFVQRRKVREVALRLAMSEADFYRKQRVAIEALAGIVAEMERSVVDEQNGHVDSASR